MDSSTVSVKQETLELGQPNCPCPVSLHARIIAASSPSSGSPVTADLTSQSFATTNYDSQSAPNKKARLNDGLGFAGPLGFHQPLPLCYAPPPVKVEAGMEIECPEPLSMVVPRRRNACRQFWKAGDFEANPDDLASSSSSSSLAGLDRVRVHPKFLHSNATSHKWALGAFAELLDNSLDEVCNGATYVNVDMIKNEKDGSKMLLVEDDGGGMTREKMRHCMSLGYSSKSKQANTIGQYGNGFKTSTMRLGADVMVFSRNNATSRPTQTIGMLSYTFLRSTGREDIVVPMIDYEKGEEAWKMMAPTDCVDSWKGNLETIIQWSPYSTEQQLLQQFEFVKEHGTRVIIYNLWEDDQELLELDFDTDPHDIQIRGVNRDEKNIRMAKQYPNSKHYLTYRHSLRSYASILYLRLPRTFRMILRGKDIQHHNIENDMMMTKKITYRPVLDGIMTKGSYIAADVTVGFVKDAHFHIDVQGFNVYHKNRLIKPFWRVWNASGSNGRGVIGVLEANFVEPAHDKQGFERTTALSRLEQRLVVMQKTYWSSNCHKVGYVGMATRTYSKKRKTNDQPAALPPPPTTTTEGSSSGEGPRSSAEPLNVVNSEQRVDREQKEGDELEKAIESERERRKSLESNLQEAERKSREMDKEHSLLIDFLVNERSQRDAQEERLAAELSEAYRTIEHLRERVRQLEAMEDPAFTCKLEK